ncbi:TPR repeat-containing protein [Ectothiorhodospira sp. PHS-1]|nr:TPR repeat-containing protein [Ectothiorhodospira sp. PHS-1]
MHLEEPFVKSLDRSCRYPAALALLVLLSGCAAVPDMRPPPRTPVPAPAPVPQAPAPIPAPALQPEVRAPQAPVIAGDTRTQRPSAAEPARPVPPVAARPQQPPAVVALAGDADRHMAAGQPERAAAALERALRIAPDDARLWHQLAMVRLHQGQADEAESLAAKSNGLARSDRALQSDNWRIIAQARRLRGDERGAMEALERARALQPGRTG